jgi:hypothetical protein
LWVGYEKRQININRGDAEALRKDFIVSDKTGDQTRSTPVNEHSKLQTHNSDFSLRLCGYS